MPTRTYDHRIWFRFIFHSYGKTIMRTLLPMIFFMAIYTTVVCYTMLEVIHYHERDFQVSHVTHSLLGVVLGLFLVFRTNSAYDRWWEGRKLWGLLVNNTRQLAMKYNAFLSQDDRANRLWFAQMITNVVFALRDNLREGAKIEVLETDDPKALERLRKAKHIPNIASSLIYDKTQSLCVEKSLTDKQFFIIDIALKTFSDIIGSCERIKNTPIPMSYMMYIKQFIFVYLITLPFAFVTLSGYLTVPIVILITFILFSIELIAEEIEEPFGNDQNDLPTNAISLKIRADVRELLQVE